MLSVKRNQFPIIARILFLLLCLKLSVDAQTDTEKKISDIIIVGNEVTKDNVILRELVIHEGDLVDRKLLVESQQRLLNLFLFNRVKMDVYPSDEKSVILVIEVTEKLYFYPAPILTLRERDWSKWSFGLSLINSNFRGQNEKLWTGFWLGYRPGFGINYTDQWAGDSLHLNTAFSIMKTIYNNHTITDLEERHILAKAAVGKWWSRTFNTAITFHFDHIKIAKEFREWMLSGNTEEQTFGLELSLKYDSRDLFSYPSKGWMNVIRLYKYGLFKDYNDYENIVLDIRRYIKIGPFIIAGRFYQNSLFGDVPIYRLNYIGFSERIRGYFYNEWQGRHVQIGSIETRFNIIPVRYFSFNLPAIPSQYLNNLPLGLSAALFVDTGIVWVTRDQYAIDNFKTGFGMGLHIHLPYIEIFRIDLGFNRQLNSQLIFEIGVVF